MKKIVFIFSALLICGMTLTFTGCGNTPTYFSCEDKFQTSENGWKRGIEDNEIISNLSTKGLNNVAYDFSYIKEQNYGLASAQTSATFSTLSKNEIGNMKSDTIKFEGVSYSGFLNYASYLFSDFSAYYNANFEVASSPEELMSRFEQDGTIYYEFKAFLLHGSKYYNVEIFYVLSGSNSMVSATEMYVTVPVYLKNKLKEAEVVTKLGDVVETWPGWTHLNYAKTPMYRYIPSIYSEYYEVSEVDGLTQIYVPNYTEGMINFYENELKNANFVAGDLDGCEVLANIVKKSIGHTNVRYFTYTMVNNIWHLAVFENSGYMQISCYLSDRNRTELDFTAYYQNGNTFDDYYSFQRAFNEVSCDLGISIPFKNYSFIDNYYFNTLKDYLGHEVFRVGFKMTSITPYQTYKQGIEEIEKNLYRDFINQGAGIYPYASEYEVLKRVEGINNCFYQISSNLKVFDENQYNYTFKATDDRELIINAIENGGLVYDSSSNSWVSIPFVIYGHNYLRTDENDRIIYELNYYVDYTLVSRSTEGENLSDLPYAISNLQQNILDAEVLSGYIEGLPIIIQKQDNYIYFTVLTADELENCYREVIFFQDENSRLEFEKNKTLLGNETFYSSSEVSGKLSKNLEDSKIISYLHKFYALQTDYQNFVDEYVSRYIGDEKWIFKFVEENSNPSSQSAIMNGFYIEAMPAFKQAGLKKSIWFSTSGELVEGAGVINFGAYKDESGKLKINIYAISKNSQFEYTENGNKIYSFCASISDTTVKSFKIVVDNFIATI